MNVGPKPKVPQSIDVLINYQDKHPDPLQVSQDWILENNKPPLA